MVRINGYIEVPDGTEPGRSRRADGAFSTNVYDNDTRKLHGNVPFHPDANEKSEEDEGASDIPPKVLTAIALAVGVGIGVAVAKRKEIKARAGTTWKQLSGRTDEMDSPIETVERANVVEPAQESPSTAIQLPEPVTSMTSAEWQERFRIMVLAGALSEEQWRALANARVEDGDSSFLELQSELRCLTAQQFVDRMKMVLASGDSSSADGATGDLIKLFGMQRDRRI